MMVHFFTDRLARVDLVFILRALTLMLEFDSTCMGCPRNCLGPPLGESKTCFIGLNGFHINAV